MEEATATAISEFETGQSTSKKRPADHIYIPVEDEKMHDYKEQLIEFLIEGLHGKDKTLKRSIEEVAQKDSVGLTHLKIRNPEKIYLQKN